MNPNFKSKWNAQNNTWVAVSELASSAGKTRSLVSSTSKSQLINTGKLCSVVLTAFMTLPAFAIDCHREGSAPGSVEALVGSEGDDFFVCSSGDFVGFDGLGGQDFLSLNSEKGPLTVNGDITFGNVASSLRIENSATHALTIINSNITMGSDNDYIHVVSSSNTSLDFNATVSLGDGDDTFNFEGAVTVTKDIHTGAGNDVLYFRGASSSAILNSDLYGEEGDDRFDFYHADIDGKIIAGADNDAIDIINSNIGNNFELDGGTGDDFLFVSGNLSVAGEKIINMERLRLGQYDTPATLTLTGSQLNLLKPSDNSSQLYVFINSTLKFDTAAFTINFNDGTGLLNKGTIDLRRASAGTTVTLNGNYEGTAGEGFISKLLFNTVLGNDASITDKLIINGNSSGSSAIFVTNKGGTGAQTVNGINLVEISGNSDANFSLGAPVQAGGYEYFLHKVGKNWALKSQNTNSNVTPTPTPLPTPSPTPSPQGIYRPGVAGYLQAAQAQFDQSTQVLSRYDQRQEKIVSNNDIWGRLIANQTDLKTDTFGYHQSNQNLQFGKNIGANDDNSTAGVTLGFGFQSANYKDKNRAFTKAGENTGNSKTSQYHLGAYYSQQNANNQYVDLQTQITSSTTKFNDVYDTSAKQSGLGVAVSAEVGKSFALGDSGFEITPQAQFIYQNTSYKAFHDSVSSVGKQTAESLRVRAGASLKPNKAAAAPGQLNWSTSLNVWQEVLDTPTRTVAGNEVKSNLSQKPWLELGLGLTQKLNEASSLNAQVNLQNSISGTQKTGASIHLAYQLKW